MAGDWRVKYVVCMPSIRQACIGKVTSVLYVKIIYLYLFILSFSLSVSPLVLPLPLLLPLPPPFKLLTELGLLFIDPVFPSLSKVPGTLGK